MANNMYVCADNAGASALIANRTAIGTWEKFRLVANSDGTVSLLAMANNMYVCADNAGASALIANRTAIGTWEKFDLITSTVNTPVPPGATPTPTRTPGPTVPGYAPVPGKIEAESYSAMSGIQTENTTDSGGGLNVGWIDAGDWMEYNVTVTAGTYYVQYRVAAMSSA
ncbi:MAG: carbohydrate-binding protein, partial [Spirochaetales bacterium]|nr:carbohydrate-binding protein [Spirochaetales bacterium]